MAKMIVAFFALLAASGFILALGIDLYKKMKRRTFENKREESLYRLSAIRNITTGSGGIICCLLAIYTLLK
jgi:hypothetical protein